MSVTEEKIQELNRRFLEFMSKSENVETATKEIYDDLLDEVLMGFVFDVHRTTKTGSSDVEEGIPDDESYAIVGYVYLLRKCVTNILQDWMCLVTMLLKNFKIAIAQIVTEEFQGVSAFRFATHLEKCMGMGRNSSRVASRRIANNSKDLGNFSDNDNDVDWSLNNGRRKRRKDRNGMKRTKQQKNNQRNGETVNEHIHSSNENSPSNYENMSLEDKRILLTQICGVISEHTKKLCTRSMRCPQHTEDQRKEMRANLESGNNIQSSQDNLHVDVDTYEEGDGQNLREALARWDREGSSHSSPADSKSTTSTSSISRKRETKSKGKGKGSKRDRGSPISQGD
ncbi:Ataxin-7-like protein 3 [Melipona quadrifasciata]|uniref:Ataxin-7-like protein 3 n=1 Tax=Melipona quadrifasciata TaxID=166423 RepID=A0A0N0BJ69_9HYME|nr:Ataxin-7-like protein 3 [Melipona quadrifasciata]